MGFVTGSAVAFRDFGTIVRMSLLSEKKRRESAEIFLKRLRHNALQRLVENAKGMGANAVLGVRIHVWRVDGNTYEAYAYGTAAEVRASKSSSKKNK